LAFITAKFHKSGLFRNCLANKSFGFYLVFGWHQYLQFDCLAEKICWLFLVKPQIWSFFKDSLADNPSQNLAILIPTIRRPL
jgi:hypothetical protein